MSQNADKTSKLASDGTFVEMEVEDNAEPPSRFADTIEGGGIWGALSYLTFSWAGPFLQLGSTKTLGEEDLMGIDKKTKSRYLYNRFQKFWKREKAKMEEMDRISRMRDGAPKRRGRRKGITLLMTLLRTSLPNLWRIALSLGVAGLFHILQALSLGWLISYFDDSSSNAWEGWVFASVVVLAGLLFSFCHHMSFFQAWMTGLRLRTCMTTVVYDKILRLRLTSLGQVTTGHLVNLATSDMERFQYAGMFSVYLIMAPLETLVVLFFGLTTVGMSFLAGFAALGLLVPLQAVFSRRYAKVRRRVTALTDERVKLTNQAVTGARLMKISAWESTLTEKIKRVRAEEVRTLLSATFLRAINEAMFFVQPSVLVFLVFATHYLLGEELRPSKVFTTMALLSITQFTMGKFFYLSVQSTSEGWVSIGRMESILLMEENNTMDALHSDKDLKGHTKDGKSSGAHSRSDGTPDDEMNESITITLGMTGSHARLPPRSLGGSNGVPLVQVPPSSAAISSASGDGKPESNEEIPAPAKKAHRDGVAAAAAATTKDKLPGSITVDSASFKWNDRSLRDEHALDFSQAIDAISKKGKGSCDRTRNRSRHSKGDGHSTVEGPSNPDSNTASAETPGSEGKGELGGSTDGGCADDDRDRQGSGYVLQDVNLRVEPGQLVGIVGPVGSSKSTLLMALLREIAPIGESYESYDVSGDEPGGRLRVDGRMAYASQEPWIQSGTLRDNILFGKAMDSARYEGVIKDCALSRDLSILPSGDMTVIGDRGVNLSGGQKARVGLARMAYAMADIYIMDDPLSAVDPAVGRELFSSVVCGRLAGSTRLLVTHQIHYLRDPAVDVVIVMQAGRIVARGRYATLEVEGKLAALERSMNDEESDVIDEEDEPSDSESLMADLDLKGESADGDNANARGKELRARSRSRSRAFSTEAGARLNRASSYGSTGWGECNEQHMPGELVVTEDKETGNVKCQTYWEYASEAAGPGQVFFTFNLLGISQALVMGVSVWLAVWSEQDKEEQKRDLYVGVLALMVLLAILVSGLRAILTFFSLVKASHHLHDRMLERITRAPVLFFDSNPVGRILNRFTKDLYFMDDFLPMALHDFLVCAFMVLGSTILVLVANPWVLLSLVPAGWYFVYLLGFYLKTSREVKRVEATTRSPVYSQLSETLDGLVTIRAFGAQRRFLAMFIQRLDLNSRAFFAYIFTARWLGFRLDLAVILLLSGSCFLSVVVNEFGGNVDGALLGAALVYVMQLGGLFQWTVRQAAEVENQMVSAERVLAYCKVDQEAKLDSEPEHKPPDDWPTTGNIEIRGLVLRYRHDFPAVLKGISVSIKGRSRVGVVGRTGAGKSTLITALFRLVEYDKDRGGIVIDGVDIGEIGLHDLRPRMSVVPQTPFLFSGSMRLNLDPFAKHSDASMWQALEAVQMKDYVAALPGALDAPVTEGGNNLSVGQRQLLCLARAVLQRSQILLMDEATANIDQRTDSLIQNVVRSSFRGRTVIMIAHRLETVIDCDQIIVLSEGKVVETGHPHELLRSSTGGGDVNKGVETAGRRLNDAHFSSMVNETGPDKAESLRRLAKDAWEAVGRRGDANEVVA